MALKNIRIQGVSVNGHAHTENYNVDIDNPQEERAKIRECIDSYLDGKPPEDSLSQNGIQYEEIKISFDRTRNNNK